MNPALRQSRSKRTTVVTGGRAPATTAVAAALFLVAASTPACNRGGATEDDLAALAGDASPTIEELANATYAGVFDEPVTLIDGRWEGTPFVEGGAARPAAGLVENFLIAGDLNGDRREDAVVLLWESSGGSGTRSHLAAMGRVGGAIVNLGTTLIGDRVQVKDGFIVDGLITLDLIQAGPGEAACCPTQKALVGWRLTDGVLSPVESVITGTLSLEDLEGPEWVLVEIGWGNPVPQVPPVLLEFEGDKVTGNGGCNGYFGTVTGETPGKLGFGAMGTTMMACPEATMEIERRYLQALAQGSSYSFTGGRLVIGCETEDGPLALIFARPEASVNPEPRTTN
jgi:heat shock protein HslJ